MPKLTLDLEQAARFGGLTVLKGLAVPQPCTDLKEAAQALHGAAEEVLDAIEAAAQDQTLTRTAERGLARLRGAFKLLPDPVAEPKRFRAVWTSTES
jgi:hypothetical protein